MKDDNVNPAPSIFDLKSLREIHEEIKHIYLSDNRPWVIGYSGGKDSTTALQLIWRAVAELPTDKRLKPIHVISTDTLVETPVIVDFVDQTLKRIDQSASRDNMPFKAHRLKPLITESFWVNLIGRGYPAPQLRFRWCTDRLKIEPANRFIMEQISRHGEVIIVLGVRRQESATRAQVMNLYQIPNSILSRHSQFPQAYVYTPIRDWSTDDVWSYLLQVSSPWGNNNRDLVALYQTAQGECPVVVDDTTPSCGNSRFGCWVCTVVTEDKSMKALIDSGETWLQPLLEIRNLLALTQDPNVKPFYRGYKRRSGEVTRKSDGSGIISRGPYWPWFRKQLLEMVLKAQVAIEENRQGTHLQLILLEELLEIRRIWRTEEGDWEDSVPRIYRAVMRKDLDWPQDDITFSSSEKSLLSEICRSHNVPLELVTKLFEIELQSQSMTKRSSVYGRIDRAFAEEWRTEEEILNESNVTPRGR